MTMTTVQMYNVVLDEFGFGPLDEEGNRVLESKRFPGGSCWANFNGRKIEIQGVGKLRGYSTGDIMVSEMQLRQLLTILVSNHI